MPAALTTTRARTLAPRARLEVLDFGARDRVARAEEPRDPGVVENAGAVVGGGLRERHGHAGVVELAVVVHDAAEQIALLDVGDARDRLLAVEDAGGREVQAAREEVVRSSARSRRTGPPTIGSAER